MVSLHLPATRRCRSHMTTTEGCSLFGLRHLWRKTEAYQSGSMYLVSNIVHCCCTGGYKLMSGWRTHTQINTRSHAEKNNTSICNTSLQLNIPDHLLWGVPHFSLHLTQFVLQKHQALQLTRHIHNKAYLTLYNSSIISLR